MDLELHLGLPPRIASNYQLHHIKLMENNPKTTLKKGFYIKNHGGSLQGRKKSEEITKRLKEEGEKFTH